MKLIALLLIIALLFCGCASGGGTLNGTDPSVDPSESISTDSQPTGDPATVPTDPSVPNTELAALEMLFQYGKENWYNFALTGYYTEPKEIDLAKFFGGGFQDIPAAGPTPEEIGLLKDMPGFDAGFDLIRLPAERMEAVLQEFWGIGLSEFDLSKSALYYVESTNCYYLSKTDAGGCSRVQFESMVVAENGIITVEYMADYRKGTLTLMQEGDGYRILSNIAR